ncbi:F0F1 ATP synthase subunit A [Candidatus Palauibacter soopunensis]|uniref:F0F1 ATP synthase subunit A n=1 Tax=Candidatus Palauibacter soopunensis TaxID=3056739 RepID=UPI00239CD641|nr:F0F1 ATP synthase subunit A [Candidatus Palauibacter soopunensis]MDE2880190.1 F0F1 ATP synthase subunit A [Candidatus Palauibacter soopunensis]
MLDRSMASLRSLAERVQEHAAPAAAAAQEHHGEAAAAGEHAEEWGTEVMMHHVVDSNIWEFGPFGQIHLPEFPAFNIGGLEIDLSITKHVLFLMFAAILTIVTMFIAARSTERLERGEKAPGGLLNGIEAFYLYLRDDIVMANIGRGGERFVPLVITFFFFILYANLLGLIPFGATATGNIMVTAALAIIALVVIETAGFIALGPLGYAKTVFFLPPGLPGPLKPVTLLIMAPVELIAKFSKIMALAIRLFANMTAGHFVILAFMGLILTYGSMVGQGLFGTTVGAVTILGSMGLALFVMMLEIFIALLQAYIFAMLVSVFIGLIRHAH